MCSPAVMDVRVVELCMLIPEDFGGIWRRAAADRAPTGGSGDPGRGSSCRRAIRRNEVRRTTSSARRWLSAPCLGTRLRHRAGHRRGRTGSASSLRPPARATSVAGPGRRGCAHQWSRACEFSARRETGLARATWHLDYKCSFTARWLSAASRGRKTSCFNCARLESSPPPKPSTATTMPTPRNDIRDLLALKTNSEAGGFVTTEKDAVNLGGYFSALEPLAVVPVKMELVDAANAVDTMLRIVDERKNRA